MSRHQTRARAPATEVMAISSEDLVQCRRDRDFTNILDLRNCWHTSFLKRLREHGYRSCFLWKQLQESEDARSECIDSFLDIYGMEYWGDRERRGRYLMPDSIARGDVVKYPENRTDSRYSAPKKPTPEKRPPSEDFDFIPEERESSGEGETETETELDTEAEVNIDDAEEEIGVEATASQLPVSMSQDMAMTEPAFMPVASANIPTATCRVRRRNTIEHRMTPPSDESSASSISVPITNPSCGGSSNVSTGSLVDANLARALYAKYRRDTFFLITTDGPHITAAAWHKYKDFGPASSFLLDMGRARGLENRWWTAEAQMMIDGESGPIEADYVLAAKDVISEASVTLEWSGEEVLVRWDNKTTGKL
ncbi:hypothetical protein BJX68DRAFT_265356 [Aspergillus pseudodeflectus]|uniref:Uncharacterized protein n=1 Tax=Aspergillus pseudodeflectus TaxID=176178 RepID=A0ABR4KM60_9EURO